MNSIIRWFDTYAGANVSIEGRQKRIDWIQFLPFLAMHFTCLAVFWVGWSWIAITVALSLYFVRMFAITAFYHRYFSHRSFKTSRLGQLIFGILGASAVQRGPLWWAAHHRRHHRYSDKEGDIHSPHLHGLMWSHMFWFMTRSSFSTPVQEVNDLYKYPELRFLDRFDLVVPLLLAVSLYSLGVVLNIVVPRLGTNGMQMLIWGFFVSTTVLFHGTNTINSLAHKFGRKRYPTGDESRNNLFLALITLGEGWHNNHHFYPSSSRQGFYWWEIDITYYGLIVLSKLRLVWDLRPVPRYILTRGEKKSPNSKLSGLLRHVDKRKNHEVNF